MAYDLETGAVVYQRFKATVPTNVTTTMPACLIGPLYQVKKDAQVNATDLSLFRTDGGSYDALTAELSDADIKNMPVLTTNHKVVIESPDFLAGVYDISSVDLVNGKVKINNISFVPSAGSNEVSFYIYNPTKSYTGRGVICNYPGLIKKDDAAKTSLVDTASVGIKIKDVNGLHAIAKANVIGQVTDLTLEAATMLLKDGKIAGIAVGHFLYVEGFGFYKVTEIAGDDVKLAPDNGVVPVVDTVLNGYVYSAGFIPLETEILVTPGIKYKGQMYVSYRALRRDSLYEFIRVQYVNDITEQAGPINSPENPLGYAGGICAMATGEAVEFFLLPTEGNSAQDHQQAIDYLYTKKMAYYITPLTNDEGIIEMYKSHINLVTKPMEKWFAVGFFSKEMPTCAAIFNRGYVEGPALDNTEVSIAKVTGNIYKFTDTNVGVDFEVMAEDINYIVISTATNTKTFPVLRDATHPVDRNSFYFTATEDLSAAVLYKYVVANDVFTGSTKEDKIKQAQAWAKFLQSCQISDASGDGTGASGRRFFYSLPDWVMTTYGDVVPSYFMCAAIAGMKTAYPASQPIAELPIPGIEKVYHSTDYFNAGLMKLVNASGCMFAYQPSEDSIPRLMSQSSCDLSTIKTSQLSTVTAVDAFSIRLVNTLCSFFGRTKITKNALDTMRIYTNTTIDRAKENGELKDGRILQMDEDVKNPGHAIIEIDLDTFDPLLGAKIYLNI